MNIVDVLFTAGGGGIFGSLTSLCTSWVQHRQKLEEMRLTAELAEKSEAWKAFTASLSSDAGLEKLPENTWSFIANFYVFVEGFRRFTRPGLTWALPILLYTAPLFIPNLSEAQWNSLSFGTWTAIFWWFGSRPQQAASKS